MAQSKPKVAIVHDWLIGGGAELVVEQLHKLYPEAPIYTSYCSDEWRKRLDNKVVTGYLQGWPFSKLRKFIPFLRGWWFSSLNLKNFDLVISSSGAEAKFIKVKKPAVHIAYIHAPTHYYWSRYEQYLKNPGFGVFDWLARIGLKILVGPMRRWDFQAAKRPDYLIANSGHTKNEIKKYYGRDSEVIYPPVDINHFKKYSKPTSERSGFIIVGRQTPYKKIDLAVRACTELDLPLTVIGDGPDHQKLIKMAGASVDFKGKLNSHEDVAEAVGSAKAFIFPGIDDFGIVSIEALAAGTPVVAYKAGGALDYIKEGKNGLFFDEQTVDSLARVLQKIESQNYSADDIKSSAKEFSIEEFHKNMKAFIRKVIE